MKSYIATLVLTIYLLSQLRQTDAASLIKKDLFTFGDDGMSVLNDNGIVTVINGMVTVLNESGIFTYPVNPVMVPVVRPIPAQEPSPFLPFPDIFVEPFPFPTFVQKVPIPTFTIIPLDVEPENLQALNASSQNISVPVIIEGNLNETAGTNISLRVLTVDKLNGTLTPQNSSIPAHLNIVVRPVFPNSSNSTNFNASAIPIDGIINTINSNLNKTTKQKREIISANNFGFTSLTSNGINGLGTVINSSGIFFTDNDNNSIVNQITQGQSISFNNGVITLTNSTGVYIGSSMDNLKQMSGNAQPSKFVALTNIGPNQSVSITNGIITLANSSGVFVGTSVDNLTKLQ